MSFGIPKALRFKARRLETVIRGVAEWRNKNANFGAKPSTYQIAEVILMVSLSDPWYT